MTIEIGDQYDMDNKNDPSGFLAKARLHQSKFRASQLKVPHDEYGNYLTKEDALKGLNFYPDFNIFNEVKKRYPKYSKPLYANMLRSEHIPFNLFIPLKSDLDLAKSIFNELMSGQIESIDKIEIEYAPKPASKYLDDRTSFDTYIEYTHRDTQKGIIGIEVKYTEREYKLGKKTSERRKIENKNSVYYKVSQASQLYKPNSIDLLITDKFRQIWRNQLLGESIILNHDNDFQHFTSMTFFPKGNVHFVETSKEYMQMLIENNDRFVPVYYEDYFSQCNGHIQDSYYNVWIKYLKKRYII
jgi:hypothetical protein